MEILTPPRIATLTPRSIRVIEHTSAETINERTFNDVFPFETIFSIKQRISLAHRDDKSWLPHHLFIAAASAEATEYTPLEFQWPFSTTLVDPLTAEIVGRPDDHIYEDGAKKPVFPTILSGATVETVLKDNTIHVWNYTTVAAAAGFSAGRLPTDESFEGFFQLYFPAINRRDNLTAIFTPLSESDKEIFTVAAAYRTAVDDRLRMIENAIKSGSVQQAEPVTLRELYRVRFTLPKKPTFQNGLLELKFYEMEPTAAAPFIRFFPASDRSPPLIKLASVSGAASIRNTKILDSLMAEQPTTDNGAVILIKTPVESATAFEGTAWTLAIMEDGSAQLYMNAPRKNQPISYRVYEEAVRALPTFLAATPWADATTTELVEIQALYEFRSKLAGGRPGKGELRSRLNIFLPLFLEDKVPAGDSAALALRYKAVNNFKADKNPVMNFITHLYFRESPSDVEALPIPMFITAIAEEFGIGPTEAADYMRTWISRNAEYITVDGDTAVPAVSLGSLVNLYNSHPKYMFDIRNAESQLDLNRILTLMVLFTSVTSETFALPAIDAEQAAQNIQTGDAAVPPAVVPNAPPAPEEVGELDLDLELAMMGMLPAEEEVVEHAQELAPSAPPPAPAPAAPRPPTKHDAASEKLPSLDQWALDKLKERDSELFDYKKVKGDARVAVYSRACQSSQHKQPNVMPAETYERMRAYYGDRVFWVEVPFLDHKDYQISMFAIRSVKERKRDMAKAGLNLKESVAAEKRALELGFPLAGDASITSLPDVSSATSDAEKAEIAQLMVAQKSKPLWIVVRLGTKMDMPNYYICAELWCILDDVPLIESEFNAAGGCPFCGGKEIGDMLAPKMGETVYRRKPTSKGDKIAKYAGIQEKELFQPDKFALPCCFTKPDSFKVPDGAQPIPPPKVPLPPLQAPVQAPIPLQAQIPLPAPLVQEAAEQPPEVVGAPPVPPEPPAEAAPSLRTAPKETANVPAVVDLLNRMRPFSPQSVRGAAQNPWYIPNQNILGRSNVGWFELERGAAAVPPPSVNTLLGQEPEKFLTKIKGAFSEKINSYLAYPAAAFIRVGLGSSKLSPGINFLNMVSFAEYAVEQYRDPTKNSTMRSPEDMLAYMLETREYEMSRAFIQANYGTLVHEFARPDRELSVEEEKESKAWWYRVGHASAELAADQQAYGKYVYLAWINFKNYMNDHSVQKDLRYFESLFATPQLLTQTGFIIVRIVYPKGRDETPKIMCPEFGISYFAQKTPPPLLFLLEDEVTGLYDPLVFYEGLTKENRMLCGVIQPEHTTFGMFSAQVREALQGFTQQYFSGKDGCGRSAPPIHPWVQVGETSAIPRLSTILDAYAPLDKKAETPDGTPYALLRDRSNRLVGVVIRYNKKEYYIPAVDDGIISMYLRTYYGEEAMPRPELSEVLDILAGRSKTVGKKKLTTFFPSLRPRGLIRSMESPNEITGLELECNALILVKPFNRKDELSHAIFGELKRIEIDPISEWPWETDSALLTYPPTGAQSIEPTSEEKLSEAYQHVRITVSNWLNESPVGQRVKKQIELLRQARRRLPLYELQKRLDLLLFPVVSSIITTEGTSRSSMLRRDCTKITSEKDCSGGCTLTGGRCLIHAPPKTERYTNPANVLTAWLTDELLRTFSAAMEVLQFKGRRVQLLKPLATTDVIQQGTSLLFSAEGRGDDALYEKLGYLGRKPGLYTAGKVYPEEVGVEADDTVAGLPLDWSAILKYAEFGADIARDSYAKQVAAIVGITGRPITDLEARLGGPFRGGAQWSFVASELGLNVIMTYINPDTKQIQVFTEYAGGGAGAGAGPKKYVIIDPYGVPLQKVADNTFVLKAEELPASLRLG